MYLFELVCTFLLILFSEAHMTDDREGMLHGYWDVDNKRNRCILRCYEGYIASGCNVQQKWIEGMPTCVKDDWRRKLKDWGKTSLKVTAVAGTGVAAGAGVVAATPAILGLLGFGSAGVAAGSTAASIQTATTASGSLFAWAQSVGAVGYVGTAGSTVIGGGTGTVVSGATKYLVSAFTGCEAE
ncbi:uncharacterized protein LOC123556199 isoform X2 [Mercenaria mercenaria]|uniref:uncharacterized protein LOC123556199 isoform X2 n=1 Tax=Mercenaria mercenaria TaxID=6596 RepID=UPI00234ED71C|nr:uncharacterized protein LOC123556199 isoform X2 [Mercenaria mercenaria]